MIHISTLNGGDITITTGGSAPVEPTAPNGKVLYRTSADGEWLESDADITNASFNGFDEKDSAVEVIIPSKDANGNDVTSIGDGALYDCTGLTSVTIPDSVTGIGGGVFNGCNESLFDMATIPGVRLVDGWVIGNTKALSSELDLTGIRGIGYGAFAGCSGLTNVTIPDSVTGIGTSAFQFCSGLTNVTITANGGNAENVKQMVISAIGNTSISNNITWNMPS